MGSLFAMFVLLVAVCVAGGQEGATLRKRLTNQDVIEMAKLGTVRRRDHRQDSPGVRDWN